MSQNTSSPKTKTILFIGLGIAAVLFCCLTLASLLAVAQFTDFLPSLTSLFGPKWSSAKIVPGGTDFYMAADPNFRDMKNAKQLVDIYSELLERTDGPGEIESTLEEEYSISFKEDIRPWLGPEVAFAIPNLTEAINNEEPALAIIAATIDKKDSDSFLEKLRGNIERDEYTVYTNTYEGVTYYVQEVESEWETPTIFGRLKNFVVLTTHEDLMKEIIDTSQKNQGALLSNENYTQLLDSLPGEAAAVAYYDMEGFTEAFLANMNTGVTPPQEATAQLEAFEAVGVAMRLSNQGVLLDFVSTFDPEALSAQEEAFLANEGRILEHIPAGALGFLSSQNLDAGWRKLWTSLAQNPDFEQQLDDLGSSFNLTLDEELFSWTRGEYAITLLESTSQEDMAPPVSGYSIFEVNDQAKAESLMADISSLVQMMLFQPLETKTIEGVEVHVLEQAGLNMGYGFPPQHLVIGVGEDALEAGVSEDILPISSDETFQAVIGHLPDRNRGYFYVNVKNAWKFAYGRMGEYDREIFDADVRPYLEPLQAIGLATRVSDPEEGEAQGTIFFYIPTD